MTTVDPARVPADHGSAPVLAVKVQDVKIRNKEITVRIIIIIIIIMVSLNNSLTDTNAIIIQTKLLTCISSSLNQDVVYYYKSDLTRTGGLPVCA